MRTIPQPAALLFVSLLLASPGLARAAQPMEGWSRETRG